MTLARKKRFFFILITGAPAVGKFTVGKALSKKLKVVLFHNHLVIDFVKYLIKGKHNKSRSALRQKIFFNSLEAMAEQNLSLIITHAYGHNYVYTSGMSDRQYVSRVKKITEKFGGVFMSVHLVAHKKELERRVLESSRKDFKKIKSKKLLNEVISINDITTPPFKNSITINNSNLSVSQVVKIISRQINQK